MVSHCTAAATATTVVMLPVFNNSDVCWYIFERKEPDYLPFQPRFGYIDLNVRKSRWLHRDKSLFNAMSVTVTDWSVV